MLSEHSLQRRRLDPELAVLFVEVWTVIRTRLRFRDQDILRRRFLDGQTYQEIAEDWGVGRDRAMWYVRDALRRVQTIFILGRSWKYGATYDSRCREAEMRRKLRRLAKKFA